MTSMLVTIGRIYHYKLKRNYLKTKGILRIFHSSFAISIKFKGFSKKKLLTLKNVPNETRKRSSFWTALLKRVNESEKLPKSREKSFFFTFLLLWAKLTFKKSFLVRFETSELLANTLFVDYKYSRHNRENLLLSTQTQLSRKLKTFCGILSQVLKFILNFQHFETKLNLRA